MQRRRIGLSLFVLLVAAGSAAASGWSSYDLASHDGQLVVLEFFRDDPAARGEDRGVRGPLRFGLNTVIPALGRVVGRDGSAYRYLPGSMGEFLTAREFASLLEEFGFEDVFVERQTFGIAHIVGGRLKDE